MKRFSISVYVSAIGLIALSLALNSCTKEGAQGPAGQDGTDGTNGTNANVISAADSAAYKAADGIIGARLYDHWLNQIEVSDTALTKHPNFYRCKSCHGWDLLGKNGVLINKTPTASYPIAADGNLFAWSKLHNIKEIFDAVKNPGGRTKEVNTSYNGTMPYFGELLTDPQIWDLVKFLKEVAHNVNDFYDMSTTGFYPTGTKTFYNIGKGGDAAAGLVVYNANCASCHGSDGTAINIYCDGIYLGDMFRDDPHEIQHKAIWGMPIDREHIASGCLDAGMMPVINITDQDIRNMMVMGQDEVAFPGF